MQTQYLQKYPDAHRVHLPRWSIPFAKPATFKSARGGRVSSKTMTYARLNVHDATVDGNMIMMCCREFQSSINVSAKREIERAILDLGFQDFWEIQTYRVIGKNGNKSEINFFGLERNRESVRGWSQVRRIWVEEAQFLSDLSADIMVKTCARNPGIEFWFSWNPDDRTDWVYRRFVDNPQPGDVSALVNYYDNPWFPTLTEAERERQYDERTMPRELYEHVWLGEPNDAGATLKVIPHALLRKCVEAVSKGYADKYRRPSSDYADQTGLDIADSGMNFNAMVARRGPLVTHVVKWRAPHIGYTARYADRFARNQGVGIISWDTGGMGASVKAYFDDMSAGRSVSDNYWYRGELFGGSIKGPKRRYSFEKNNEETFMRRNAQMGWALRIKAENTARLLNGEDVNPDECLFIDPELSEYVYQDGESEVADMSIMKPGLSEFLAQLSQPTWRENESNGKIEIEKRDPEEIANSPDLYDAAILAFSHDSEGGLTKPL